jgi:transposase
LDISPDTVRYWIKRYEEKGIDGLKDEDRPGRPPVITPFYLETLLALVPKSPREAGYPINGWTTQLLSHHLERITNKR